MASTVEEYLEVMNAEVYVDIYKLRDMARHGIPDPVRGEVWKYLLGVQDPNKCMISFIDINSPFFFFLSFFSFLFIDFF